MTTVVNDKLNALFSEKEFLEASGASFDALYADVVSRIPEVTKEDLAEYVIAVGKAIDKNNGELSEDALDDVAGGITLLAIVVGGVIIGVSAYAGAKVGPWIGEAIYYARYGK